MPKGGLGKGLGAIFGNDAPELIKEADKEIKNSSRNKRNANASKADSSAKTNEDKDNVSRETSTLKISLIEPNAGQPRKNFDKESLDELTESIKKYGVIQPVIVRKKGELYTIIAGERRWRAAKQAGLKEIPVIIKEIEDRESAEISIIENIQREDLNPVEEARAYKTLIDEYGLKQEDIAERVSKNRSTITNSLRLLNLCDEVLDMLESGQISAGHARCLITVEDKETQKLLADRIVEAGLSVRETEKLVKNPDAVRKGKEKKTKETKEKNIYIADIERRIGEELGTQVVINEGKKGSGKIVIDYYSQDDLDKIIAKLM